MEGAYKKLLLRNYVEDLDEGEIDGSNEIEEVIYISINRLKNSLKI